MKASMPEAPTENRNAGVIAGLREIANFLEAHPDLPGFVAHVGHYSWGKESRDALTAVADALGDRGPSERVEDKRVYIEAKFGERVTLAADARVADLGGVMPPTPRYEPIIDPKRDDGELTW